MIKALEYNCNELLLAQQNIQNIAVNIWDKADSAKDNYEGFCEVSEEGDDDEFA